MTMSTIVVGYDGSPHAREAVRHAVRLADGGKIFLVHAYDAPPPQLSGRWRELLEHDHVERAQSILDAILLEGNDELANADWEARLAPGEPAEAVLAVAREVDADSIVVGSHGYGPMTALLGSVSHDLLRIADRPVTVIPPGASH
jgi:nucleotide-binding universal stress UspA family protein